MPKRYADNVNKLEEAIVVKTKQRRVLAEHIEELDSWNGYLKYAADADDKNDHSTTRKAAKEADRRLCRELSSLRSKHNLQRLLEKVNNFIDEVNEPNNSVANCVAIKSEA